MKLNPSILEEKLKERTQQQTLRSLSYIERAVDFSSNDYLGFSRDKTIDKCALSYLENYEGFWGSTGSRLLTGHHVFFDSLEQDIANFHKSEKALLFNSGYDANIGLLSCVPQRADTILYDSLVHASIRDGIRLSYARSIRFEHNSIDDLKHKFKNSKGNVFIVIESLYSMDGTLANIEAFVEFARVNNCYLIVDEAHATGVYGDNGQGYVQCLGLEEEVFARVHTFGKALGCHGAVILGSSNLYSYLINFARSLIYTTALPLYSLAYIKAVYRTLQNNISERLKLFSNIKIFKSLIKEYKISSYFIDSHSPIQVCFICENKKANDIAKELQTQGFDVRPILYPTVPKGKERLRICLHSFNKEQQIRNLILLFAKYLK